MNLLKRTIILTVMVIVLNDTHGKYLDELKEQKMHPRLKDDARHTDRVFKREGEDTQEFWLNQGKEFILKQQQQKQNTKIAKNVIMFLGDGMGLTTLVAARNYIEAEHTKLSFEEFPYTGLAKTYSVDKIVPDSANAATAYLCGVKANYGTIGVNAAILRYDCEGMKNSSNHVYSIAKWAMDAGKSAGFITNTRLTDASPAGVYANTANREWESDAKLKTDCGTDSVLPDIAQQLIHGEVGSKLKVMMGGGKSAFLDKKLFAKGSREDGRNLIEEYLQKSNQNVYVETKEDLHKVDLTQTERLLAIFSDGHMDYHLNAMANENNTQPSLEEMTKKAIEFMQLQEDEGYFLFVEGGEIDVAHHDTQARCALDETKEFSQAIALARQMTSEEDTLIVVTSDHSSAFSVAGYQNRGSDIFSLVYSGTDHIPYTALSYANGKGYYSHFNEKLNKRVDPSEVLKDVAGDVFPATVPVSHETHGGEDVGVFASGPWSHLFTGVYEQNAIPHMMAYASCVGNGLKACDVLSV